MVGGPKPFMELKFLEVGAVSVHLGQHCGGHAGYWAHPAVVDRPPHFSGTPVLLWWTGPPHFSLTPICGLADCLEAAAVVAGLQAVLMLTARTS